ncbi:hypothetical protein DIPPA_30141 [Diplonema papillatum]|nr:hypothetical protein DIPPA_30141 [Diplonema papillatum]
MWLLRDRQTRSRCIFFPLFVVMAFQGRFMSLFYRDRGLSDSEIGWVMSISALVSVVSAPVWSGFADQAADPAMKEKLLVASFLGAELFFALQALVDLEVVTGGWKFPFLFAARTLASWFVAPWYPLATAISVEDLTARCGPDGSKNFGIERLWGAVSWLLAHAGLGFLIDAYGTHVMYYGHTAATAVAVYVVLNWMALKHPDAAGGAGGGGGDYILRGEEMPEIVSAGGADDAASAASGPSGKTGGLQLQPQQQLRSATRTRATSSAAAETPTRGAKGGRLSARGSEASDGTVDSQAPHRKTANAEKGESGSQPATRDSNGIREPDVDAANGSGAPPSSSSPALSRRGRTERPSPEGGKRPHAAPASPAAAHSPASRPGDSCLSVSGAEICADPANRELMALPPVCLDLVAASDARRRPAKQYCCGTVDGDVVGLLVKSYEHTAFFVLMFVTAAAMSLVENLLFLFFTEALHANNAVCGVSVAITVVFEIPLFAVGPRLLTLGVRSLLLIGSACYIVRVYIYTVIPAGYWVLLVEPLHGFTIALMTVASNEFIVIHTPKGRESSGQALLSSVRSGAGYFLGTLGGGYVDEYFGDVVMYRSFGAGVLVASLLYAHAAWRRVAPEGERPLIDEDEVEEGELTAGVHPLAE